jgi:hypothetical protein
VSGQGFTVNPYQLTAQKMSKIKIQAVHFRSSAKKGGLRLGKVGGATIFQQL